MLRIRNTIWLPIIQSLFLTLFFIFVIVSPSFAAPGINRTLNFQGKVVLKSDGTNLTTTTYPFIFKLYDDPTAGNQLPTGTPWSESQTLTVTDGIFRATLGSITPIPAGVDFNSDSIYLSISFNGELFTSRIRLTAVPYAYNSEKVSGLTVTNTTGTLTIPSATTVTFSGANNLTFTTSALTSATLPSGTITLADTTTAQVFTNKTIGSTGLVFNGAATDISTVSNEHFSIMPNGTGNVGIGTTAPVAKLDILGNLNVSTYATLGGSLAVGYNNAPAGPGNAIFSGNVGIGTTTPSTRLDVSQLASTGIAEEIAHFAVSDDANAYMSLRNGSTTDGLFSPQLRFKGSGSTTAGNIQAMITTDTGTSPAWVFTGQQTSSAIVTRPLLAIRNYTTDVLNILANGNVGIGTTAPSSLLSLVQTSTTGSALGISRNLDAASTDSPLVSLIQNNSGDDQNAVSIQNNGTGTGLYVTQGTTGTGMGLSLYSNVDATANSALANISVSNSAFDQFALHVSNNGNNTALRVSQGTTATGRGLSIYSNVDATAAAPLADILATNAAFDQTVLNVSNAGTGSGVAIANSGTGAGLYINQSGTGVGLSIYSDVDASANQPLVYITANNTAFDQTLFRLQQNGAADIMNVFDGTTEVFTILDGGNVGIGTTAPAAKLDVVGANTEAAYGTNLLTNGDFGTGTFSSWTAGAGWSVASNTALHTSGNTGTLSQNIAVVSGTTYEIEWTDTGSVGSYTFSIGATSSRSYNTWTPANAMRTTIVAPSTGTLAFAITPDTTYNGSLDNITVRAITSYPSAVARILNSDGTVGLEFRAGGTGITNTAVGTNTLYRNTVGFNNTALGAAALSNNTTGYGNNAQGVSALSSNTTGFQNTAIGTLALRDNTLGNQSTAIGNQALQRNTTGYSNTANGAFALYYNTTGWNNTALGNNSLYTNSTGQQNTGVGINVLYNSTNSFNTGLGAYALQADTSGGENTALGRLALGYITTSSNNTAVGNNAGYNIADGTSANATSSNSLYLGDYTKAMADGDTNEIVIGHNTTGVGSNSVVLGNDSVLNTILKGNVGIGTTAPGRILTVSKSDAAANMNAASSSVIRLVNPYNSGANERFTGMQFNFLNDADAQTVGMIGAVLTDTSSVWAGDLVFGTKATVTATDISEYMRIKVGGNVGIGTTAPTQKLDVLGNATASGNITMGGQLQLGRFSTAPVQVGIGSMYYNTTTSKFQCYQGAAWVDCIGGGGAPAWSSITAPGGDLSLAMTSWKTTFTYNATTSTNNLFNLTDTTGNTGTGYLMNLSTAATSTLHPFRVSVNNGTEALMVDSTGYVGIGTTAPSSVLSLVQTSTTGSTLGVSRNLAAASTDSPLASLIQGNSGDDQSALKIQNDGTGLGLDIEQGTTGVGTGLNVYSNVNATANSSLAYFVVDNPAFDNPVVNITNHGAGPGLYLNQGTTGTSYGLSVYSNVDATSTDPLVYINVANAAFDNSALYIGYAGTNNALNIFNTGTANGININQGTTGTGTGLNVTSNVDATVNAPLAYFNVLNPAFDASGLNVTYAGTNNAIVINNNGTSNGLYINQGTTGISSGLNVYSNVDSTVSSPLAYFNAANATFDVPVLRILNAGTNNVISTTNTGAGTGVVFAQSGNGATGNGLSVTSDADSSVNSSLVYLSVSNAAFDTPVLRVSNVGTSNALATVNTGGGVGVSITQSGNAAIGNGLNVTSDADVSVTSSLVNFTASNATFDTNILLLSNAGVGNGLNISSSNTGTLAILSASGAVTTNDGINISSSNISGVITDALDVSDAEIVNALNVGANTITGAGYLVTSTGSGLTLNSTSANLALQTTTSGHITLMPGGTGNVGIGTTAPGKKLEIAGDIKLSGTLYTGAGGVTGSANQVLISDGAGSLAWGSMAVTADLVAVQKSRTTSYTLTNTFADVTLDTTDVENDTSVIQHDSGNAAQINVKETGLYEIHYHADIAQGTNANDWSFQVFKNNTSVVSGSLQNGKNSSTDKTIASNTVYASLTANDYLRVQAKYPATTGGLVNNFVFSVKRLKGPKGDQGIAGGGGGTNYFQLNGEQISPINALFNDLMVGGTSTSSAKIALQAATGNALFTGNVGIGTTNPSQALSLSKDSTSILNMVSINNTNNTAGAGSRLSFSVGVSPSFSSGYIDTVQDSGNVFSMRFGGNNSEGLSERMRINLWSGNVGIGTTAPNARLDVAGTASISGILTVGNGTTNQIQSAYGPLTLNYKSGLNSYAAGLTVQDTTGNVGIGTTAPTQKLFVAGGGIGLSNNQGITFRDNTDTVDVTAMSYSAGNNLQLDNAMGNIDFSTNHAGGEIKFTNNWATTMTLTDTNRVGIGTGAPAAKLDVYSIDTTATLGKFDWSPASLTTSTGDLFSLNIGANGTIGNIFNVMNNGGTVFGISQSAITANLPTSFNAAGDVGIAYDLSFTNTTSSYLKSAAPLYITSGEIFNSSDLTLRTYNSGSVIIDSKKLDVLGAATVAADLTVGGQTQLGRFSVAPTAIGAGALMYDTATNTVKFYNGSVWGAMGSGGAATWSDIAAPTADLSLNMYQTVGTSFATTFTYGNATSTTNLFNITDTNSNSGTGYLVNFTTGTSSTLKPFRVAPAGIEAFSINAAGSVGIGTTAPAAGTSLAISSASTTGTISSITSTGIQTAGSILSIVGNTATTVTNGLVNIAGNALTTGYALKITNTGNTLTTGGLIDISSGNTSTMTTGSLLKITSTGAQTTGSMLSVVGNSATTVTNGLVNIAGNALTTGSALKITSTGTTTLTGNLVDISSAITSGTGTLMKLTSTGVQTAGSILSIVGNSATTVTNGLVNISGNALTTGDLLSLSSSSTALSGNLLDINLSGSNAANSGSVVRISNAASNTGTALMVTNLGAGASFRVNDETGDADASPFIIDASGNVGIGLTTPGYKLDVAGDVNATNFRGNGSLLTGIAGATGGISNTVNTNIIADSDANGSGQITLTIGSTDRFTVANSGNVGIGTTSPVEKLSVNGNALIGAQVNSATTGDAAYTMLNSAAGTFGSEAGRDKVASAVIYKGKLFVSTGETDLAGIYRYDGSTTWTLITSSTLGKAISTDSAADVDAFVMTVFDGKLWIGSQNGASATAAVYYSTTADTASAGDNFTMVNSARGTIAAATTIGIQDMAVFNGALYVGTQKTDSAEIDRYDGGTTFTRVNPTVGKANAETTADKDAFNLVTCNSWLYWGSISGAATGIVAASQGSGTTTIHLTGTTGGGAFGGETAMSDINSMVCYEGTLFISTSKTAGNSAAVYYYKASSAVANVAANFVRLNPAVGKMRAADGAIIDSFILRNYRGRLYAGAQTATGDGAGALYEYTGIPLADWTRMSTSAVGAFGSQTGIDSISVLQDYNGIMYIGTDDLTAGVGAVYTWTKTQENSFALKFDSGSNSGNYGAISFVGNAQSADNNGRYGSFLMSNSMMLASAAFDYAEDYPTMDNTLSEGEIVSIDKSLSEHVQRAHSGESAIGIVSSNPGLRLSSNVVPENGAKWVPIALVGRVPVKVTASNGAIQIGDPITLSAIPGVGMKSTKAGNIIGRALTAFDGEGVGTVSVYIQNISTNGNFVSTTGNTADAKEILAQLALDSASIIDASNSASLSEIFTDRVIASKEIIAPKITTNDLVAGLIIADRIQAKQIDGIEEIKNNIELLNMKVATLEAGLNANGSTSSAQINNIVQLDSNIISSSSGLTLQGKTTAYEINIIDKLRLGLLTVESDSSGSGSIQTALVPLKLQKDSLGNLEIMGSKIVIDIFGNMASTETITARELKTNRLTILDVKDATNGAVLSSSTGKNIIAIGETSVKIQTSALSEKSLIFATPEDTAVAVAAKRIDENTIELSIAAPLNEALKVSWWIIN